MPKLLRDFFDFIEIKEVNADLPLLSYPATEDLLLLLLENDLSFEDLDFLDSLALALLLEFCLLTDFSAFSVFESCELGVIFEFCLLILALFPNLGFIPKADIGYNGTTLFEPIPKPG